MGIIEVNQVCKEYKINLRNKGFGGAVANLCFPKFEIKKAVKDLSFSINEGEMVGFIGPNGAGKSTTIKMLSGILYPTSGTIVVNGFEPFKNRKKNAQQIGVVNGQKTQLWWDLPVSESYETLRYIYKIPLKKYQKNLEIINELLGIHEFYQQPVRQLSLGQRIKADVGAILLHEPKILFLDEPTIGLDVVAKNNIRNFLREINRETNITMLLTTHDMKDIESICERVIIINRGEKLFDGSIAEIKGKYDNSREMKITLRQPNINLKLSEASTEMLNSYTHKVKFFKEDIQVQELINRISEQYDIMDLTVVDSDIDQVICDIYKEGVQ
jgi:ABC-2 type transport system ATP-binding protein